jgi:GH15 family glucan-1,4-alpha-glucosidase
LERRIADYALIGDCETAALVHRGGSIDWLCLPRFDSSACFAALLGTRDNGHWAVTARDCLETSRCYRDGTLILETTYTTRAGKARVIDFMPPRDTHADIVRIVEGLEGDVTFETEIIIRFDYGRTVPWVTRVDDTVIKAIAGPDALYLQTAVPLHGEDKRTRGTFSLRAGEHVSFVLSYRDALGPQPERVDAQTALAQTEAYWREFVDRCPKVGPWTEPVRRSLVTLKALTYAPTGGILAAPTTSLPERIGGQRNWDYRYCWLRDATFSLQAFMHLGYFEEAIAWRDWLLRAIAGDPAQLQIMYGLAGERQLNEWTVPWLEGFRDSRPVRIGNAAVGQFQLDVHGEVADAMMQATKGGMPPSPRTKELRRVGLRYLERIWRDPDEGIWETRGGRRHFVHSKVMAWVAFDRATSYEPTCEQDEVDLRRWRRIADEIHADVCEKGFDRTQNSFVQAYGTPHLDASLLQLAIVGFLPHDDPRILGTIAAIEKRLVRNGLVLRYETDRVDDGLPPGEGRFLACSFWLADNMILTGRIDDARALFEHLLTLCNDVGLLSEEYERETGEMLGNFPQAFSHVGLINTALNLARASGPAKERAASSAEA